MMRNLILSLVVLGAMVLAGCGKSSSPAAAGDPGTNLSKSPSAQEIDKALMPGQCDGAAKTAFVPEGDEVPLADLPSGDYEYQWGELFVSVIERGDLAQIHLIDTTPAEESGPGARKCAYGLTPGSNLNATGSFPKGFKATDDMAFIVEAHRHLQVAVINGEIIHSVSDQPKIEQSSRNGTRQGLDKAGAAGVDMKMYRINGTTYKMVVIFRSHEGRKTTGVYSTGFYKFAPATAASPL